MDLVVLVAELSQSDDKSYQDLDRELSKRGYSSEEIEQAVFWFSSNHDANRSDDSVLTDAIEMHGERPLRVLSEFERMSIGSESYGFLLRLLNLGIIDLDQFERIIARSIPVGPEKIHMSDVKAIACAVVFNKDVHEVEEDLFDQFDEDVSAT